MKIERIVFARDANGRLLHPTLENLWRQVESSGPAVIIEMPRHAAEYMAGRALRRIGLRPRDPEENLLLILGGVHGIAEGAN